MYSDVQNARMKCCLFDKGSLQYLMCRVWCGKVTVQLDLSEGVTYLPSLHTCHPLSTHRGQPVKLYQSLEVQPKIDTAYISLNHLSFGRHLASLTRVAMIYNFSNHESQSTCQSGSPKDKARALS